MKRVMLGLACVCLAAVSQADTLFYDSFDGDAVALNGKTTDVGDATWSASANLNTDGSTVISAGTAASYNGFLDFSPEAGYLYTLSATVDTSSGTDWLAIGFATGSATDGAFYDNAAPWILYKDNDGAGAVEAFGAWLYEGSGTKVSSDLGGIDISGEITLSVVLDTTESISASSWSMYVNEVQVHSGSWGSNPTITGVGMGVVDGGALSATIDDFTLTRAIPEPAVAGLISVFGIGLLFLRRRFAK